MTKKLWLCAWAVTTLMLAGFRPAMATLADDATFDISVGTPPADPNPVDVDENTTVSFNVELYKTNAQGQEDPNVGASSQSYSISASGGTIVSVSGGFVISTDKQSATMSKNGNNSSPSFAVSATVRYASEGTKTVSMSGGVNYTDNSSDSDSASVSVRVVKQVPIVSIESDKTSICAGGISSDVHRATLTATISYLRGKSAANKSVKFSVENSDAEYPAAIEGADADGTKTVSTNNEGKASAKLISSRLVGSTATVKALCEEVEDSTTVTMAEAEGEMTVDTEVEFTL